MNRYRSWWQGPHSGDRGAVALVVVIGIGLAFAPDPQDTAWVRPLAAAALVTAMAALLGTHRGLRYLANAAALAALALGAAAVYRGDVERPGLTLLGAVDIARTDQIVASAALLAATAAVWSLWMRRRTWRRIGVVALGAAIVALPVAAGFGALLSAQAGEPEPVWAGALRIALVLVLAPGVLLLGQPRAGQGGRRVGAWGFLAAALVVTAGPMALAQWLHSQELARVHRASEQRLARVADQLRVQTNATVLSLERMARAWAWQGRPEQNDWKTDAWLFVDHHEEIRAVAWVDPAYDVRWLVPLSGLEDLAASNLGDRAATRAALERAERGEGPAMSAPSRGAEGDARALLAVPVEERAQAAGFIVGFYALEPLLAAVRRSVAEDAILTLAADGETVYRTALAGTEREAATIGRAERGLDFHGAQWSLQLVPTRRAVRAHLTWLPEVALLVGLALAVLMGATLQQIGLTRATARRLVREVRRRSRVETALRRSHEDLEQRVAERTAELEDKQRELALTNERLEALATTDHLTGLCNRRRFHELIEAEFKTAQRHGRGFALIMFDLDRFKPVNDNYGHHAGDAVLQRVAQGCAQCLRETDRLARYGGEEFMALITEASEEAAAAVAERMRQRLAETSVDCDGATVVRTASFGVTAQRSTDANVEALLRRADAAVYAAKEAGRNRVVVAPP